MNHEQQAQSSMAKERFHEIDLLRAIACLMVVAFHYLYRGAIEGWSPKIDIDVVVNIAQYGYLGVHLFFIISGFVIFLSAANANVQEFIVSRTSRLYPAFWVAVPLTWLILQIFDAKPLEVSWQHMLLNLTMVPHWFHVPFVDGAYWSLAVELQFYILVGLAIHFKLMNRSESLLCSWLIIALANAIRPMYPLEFWLAANWAPLFCIGASAYLIRTKGLSSQRLTILISGYLLAMYYALKKIIQTEQAPTSTLHLIAIAALLTTFVLVFLLIALGQIKSRPSPFIAAAGSLTYPLYLLHEFMGYVFMAKLNLIIANPALSAFTVFAGMLVASWLLHNYIEKPIASRLRKKFNILFRHRPVPL